MEVLFGLQYFIVVLLYIPDRMSDKERMQDAYDAMVHVCHVADMFYDGPFDTPTELFWKRVNSVDWTRVGCDVPKDLRVPDSVLKDLRTIGKWMQSAGVLQGAAAVVDKANATKTAVLQSCLKLLWPRDIHFAIYHVQRHLFYLGEHFVLTPKLWACSERQQDFRECVPYVKSVFPRGNQTRRSITTAYNQCLYMERLCDQIWQEWGRLKNQWWKDKRRMFDRNEREWGDVLYALDADTEPECRTRIHERDPSMTDDVVELWRDFDEYRVKLRKAVCTLETHVRQYTEGMRGKQMHTGFELAESANTLRKAECMGTGDIPDLQKRVADLTETFHAEGLRADDAARVLVLLVHVGQHISLIVRGLQEVWKSIKIAVKRLYDQDMQADSRQDVTAT